MTQITIAAFDELLEKIETLEDALEDALEESEHRFSCREDVFADLKAVSEDVNDILIYLEKEEAN